MPSTWYEKRINALLRAEANYLTIIGQKESKIEELEALLRRIRSDYSGVLYMRDKAAITRLIGRDKGVSDA